MIIKIILFILETIWIKHPCVFYLVISVVIFFITIGGMFYYTIIRINIVIECSIIVLHVLPIVKYMENY